MKAEWSWRLCNVSRAQMVPAEAGPGGCGLKSYAGGLQWSRELNLRSCLLRNNNHKRKEFGKNCSFSIS